MKSGMIIGILIAFVVVVGAVFLFSGTNNSPSESTHVINTGNSNPSGNSGEQAVTSAKTVNVDISNFEFSPVTITINKGDTVFWTNKDNVVHTVTSDSGNELNSKDLSKGQTYSHIFLESGTYNYHCAIHTMMKAKIIVN